MLEFCGSALAVSSCPFSPNTSHPPITFTVGGLHSKDWTSSSTTWIGRQSLLLFRSFVCTSQPHSRHSFAEPSCTFCLPTGAGIQSFRFLRQPESSGYILTLQQRSIIHYERHEPNIFAYGSTSCPPLDSTILSGPASFWRFSYNRCFRSGGP